MVSARTLFDGLYSVRSLSLGVRLKRKNDFVRVDKSFPNGLGGIMIDNDYAAGLDSKYHLEDLKLDGIPHSDLYCSVRGSLNKKWDGEFHWIGSGQYRRMFRRMERKDLPSTIMASVYPRQVVEPHAFPVSRTTSFIRELHERLGRYEFQIRKPRGTMPDAVRDGFFHVRN